MQNRRKQPKDALFRFFMALVGLCWLCLTLALVSFHYARPEIEFGLLRYFEIDVREHWLHSPKNLLQVALFACCFISLCGIMVGRFRARRRQDPSLVGFKVVLVLSGVFLVLIQLIV